MNRGAGSHLHPRVNLSTTQDQLSYRYFPMSLSLDDLLGERGHTFLCQAIRLQAETPDVNNTPYSAKDLYSAAKILASIHAFDTDLSKFSTTPQSGNSCAEIGTQMALEDVMNIEGVQSAEIQRFFCHARLYSLIAASKTWKIDDREIRDHLERATRAFGIMIDDLQNSRILTEEEFTQCYAVFRSLLKQIKEAKKVDVQSQPLIKLNDLLISPQLTFPLVKIEKAKEVIEESLEITEEMAFKTLPAISTFDIKAFPNTLLKWKEGLKEASHDNILPGLSQLFATFPIPNALQEDLWDTLPEKEIASCLRLLTHLVHQAHLCHPSSHFGGKLAQQFNRFLITYTAYAIADKLARRLKDKTKLDEFTPAYWLNPRFENPQEIAKIKVGQEAARYQDIRTYFESLYTINKRQLFDFSPQIDTKEGEVELKKRGDSALCSAIQYLKQFQGSTGTLSEVWIDEKHQFLPDEIHSLRYLSFLALRVIENESCEMPPFPDVEGNELQDQLFKSLPKRSHLITLNISPHDSIFMPDTIQHTPLHIPEDSNKLPIPKPLQTPASLFDSDVSSDSLVKEMMNYRGLISENQALSTLFLKHNTYEPDRDYRDFFKIITEPSLEISSLLKWIQANLSQITANSTTWQYAIEALIFQPGPLTEIIQKQPLLLAELRKKLHEIIEYYGSNHANITTTLFFLNVSYCLETHVQAIQKEKCDLRHFDSYRKITKNLIKLMPTVESYLSDNKSALNAINAHLFFFHGHLKTFDDDTLHDLLTAWFNIDHDPSEDSEWLDGQNWQLWNCLEPQMNLCLQNSKTRNGICNSLFMRLTGIQNSGEWKGTFPIFTNGDYTLDLLSKTLVDKEGFALVSTYSNKITTHSCLEIRQLAKEQKKMPRLWVKEISNEEIICMPQDKKSKIVFNLETKHSKRLQNIKIGDNACWYEMISSEKAGLGIFMNKDHFTIWKPVEGEKAPWLVTDAITNIVLYHIVQDSKGAEIFKADELKKPLPIQVLNLEEMLKTAQKSENTKGLALLKKLKAFSCQETPAICLYNTQSKQIDSLHFLDQALSFKQHLIKDEQRLECVQHPGFYVSEKQEVPQLKSLEQCLVINNLAGESKILLPGYYPERSLARDFGSDIIFEKPFSQPFLTFTLEGGRLKGSSPQANSYLVQLYLAQRDYARAYEALAYVDFINSRDLINNINLLTDRSPEAVAFYMHLALAFFDAAATPKSFSSFDNMLTKDAKDLIKWIFYRYNDYLITMKTETIGLVPGYLRLSVKQELALQNAIKVYSHKTDQKLGSILFSCREKLLQDGKVSPNLASTSYAIYPKKLYALFTRLVTWSSKFDTLFNSKDVQSLNSGFIRYPHKTILPGHFISLYHSLLKAQPNQSCSTDLDLLAICRSNIDDATHSLMALLWVVRHNADEFKDLRFDSSDPEKQLKTLKAIFNKTQQLQKKKIVIQSRFARYGAFTYSKSIRLSLEPPPKYMPLTWGFDSTEQLSFRKIISQPLRELSATFLDKKQEPLPCLKDSKAFVLESFKPETPSEQRLHENLLQGHKENLATLNTIYSMKKDRLPQELVTKLTEYVKGQSLDLEKAAKRIEKLANKLPEDIVSRTLNKTVFMDNIRRKSREKSKQTTRITIDSLLLEAILTKNPMLLRQANPSLTEKEIRLVFAMTMEYLLNSCCVKQAQQALSLTQNLDKNASKMQWHDLGVCLDWIGDFSPTEHPEILINIHETGRFPHKEQFTLLKQIVAALLSKDQQKLSKLLCAFKAGGGKTSLLIPLLMAIAQNQGFLAAMVTTDALFPIDKENLNSSFLNAFRRKMRALEIPITETLDNDQLIKIYTYLESCLQDKTPLILTPTSYYALELQEQFALDNGDETKVLWLGKILDFYEKHIFSFLDESRINASPLSQAKLGIGQRVNLTASENQLFLALYRGLYGHLEKPLILQDGRAVADVVMSKQEALLTSDMEAVKKSLAGYLLNHPLLGIPENAKAEILAYWLDPLAPLPQALSDFYRSSPDKAGLCALTRELLDPLLPITQKMVGYRDYSYHPSHDFKEIDIVVPRRRRKLVNAFFEFPELTALLTIQTTLQCGLTRGSVDGLLKKLHRLHMSEKQTNKSKQTDAEKLYISWVGNDCIPLENTVRFDEVFEKVLDVIHPKLKHNTEAIYWFLEHSALKQVTYSSEELTSTPVDLVNASRHTILFSAYPGFLELYPLRQDKKKSTYFQDLAFASAVIQKACAKENQTILSIKENSTKALFSQILALDTKQRNALRSILDVSGMLIDYDSKEMVAEFEKFSTENALGYDGVVYFDNSKSGSEEPIRVKLANRKTPIKIEGSNLKEGLQKAGLEWEKLKLMVIYGPSQTTGADLPKVEGAVSLLLIREGLALGDAAQALLRDRLFLLLKDQEIVWCVNQHVVENIKAKCHVNNITPPDIVVWALQNEARQFDQEIVLRAYQEIESIVKRKAKEMRQRHRDNPKKQIELFKKHRKGLVKAKPKRDLYLQYAQSASVEQTAKVLWNFATDFYGRFGFDQKLEEDSATKGRLQEIITEVADLLTKIPSKPQHHYIQQSYTHTHTQTHTQECKVTQNVQTIVNQPDMLIPLSEVPLPENLNLLSTNAIKQLMGCSKPACTFFDSKSLTSTLHYTNNALTSVKGSNSSLQKFHLKPTDYLLLIKTPQGECAFALSLHEAHLFKNQMVTNKNIDSSPSHQVLLISSTGTVIQNGPGKWGFSDEQLRKWIESDWFKDVLVDIALLNGQINQPTRLMERLKKWQDFDFLWKKILEWNLDTENINIDGIEKLAKK